MAKNYGFETPEELRLIEVTKTGDLDEVKRLVESGVEIPSGLNAPVVAAAEAGHLHILKYLEEQGADLVMEDSLYPHYPFKMAAEAGHIEVLKWFLERTKPRLLLMLILNDEQPEVIKLAIEQGADVRHGKDWPLRHALNQANLKNAEVLMQHGACIGSVVYNNHLKREDMPKDRQQKGGEYHVGQFVGKWRRIDEEQFKARIEQGVTLDDLRQNFDARESGFVKAVKFRMWDKAIEIANAAPQDRLTFEDLVSQDEDGKTLIKWLQDQYHPDDIKPLLSPEFWLHNPKGLVELWNDHITDWVKEQTRIDINATVRQVERLNLRQKMRRMTGKRQGPSV